MVSMCWQTVYMSSVYITQEVNHGQELSYSYKILTALSNQLIGMVICGMFCSFLVWPLSMIYPGTLVSCSLMNTLHRTWGKHEREHISRHKLFAIVCVASALWYLIGLIPGFVFTGHMPISIVTSFDNTGMPYDVTQVMNNGTFDADLYYAYSPLFLSWTNTMCFAIFPAIIVHTILWYSRDIRRQFSSSLSDNRDVDPRLMLGYPEVPM
ncbi:uncharacterized protein PHACADRAFT_189918 [Phanerochaete carnosa HHB-10118-sp]|uniref:Uncharacterized protein n=1 Tax=Phanerochaete carnosa (strain HHB-10118-sp) TaxID=650164 RepID=K5WA31_PHACS|nr:uncharacterized protein PHACADRAFT_189918 [Phanerochaete carnosa HHB-10118-sp]EKM60788.1 hypothetical protein PHACADRAFT_189918 [Phanerochaete carnosa HHB-10118-sp]